MSLNNLNDIPDPQGASWEATLAWVNERIAAIRQAVFTPDVLESFTSVELNEDFPHSWGPEASPTWRRFFLGTLLADWACYDKPVDRVDVPRLKYVMSCAYRTFRLWVCRLPDGQLTPVGYTAWYPISKLIYDSATEKPDLIKDRGLFMPLRYSDIKDTGHAFAFNISLIKELRHTSSSRKVCLAFHNELAKHPLTNFLAAVVSEEGKTFFQTENFVPAGAITRQGDPEFLYVRPSTEVK